MTTAKPRPPLAPGETRAYPVLPLRDIVVFPHMITPLFVGRKKSILALEEVMRSDTFILLATFALTAGIIAQRREQATGGLL
jgi:ATP-dependent Lon protease